MASGEHVIDLGVQLPRKLFAVACDEVLSLRLGNIETIQDSVGITCELSAKLRVL